MFLQTQEKNHKHDFYQRQNSSLNQNTDTGRHHSGPVSPPGSSGAPAPSPKDTQIPTPASVDTLLTHKQTSNVPRQQP